MKNKIVWITGASSGIGEALAKKFNQQGSIVILSARNKEALCRVQAEFPNPQIESLVLPLDLQHYFELEEKVKIVLDKYGRVDILINNGGISQRSLALETTFRDDLKIIEIDLLGTIALSKALLPSMLTNTDSQLVVISSVMGKIHTKYRTSYAAAKHGLIGYFDSLRLELAGKVQICNIMPGFIATNIVKNAVSTAYIPNNQNDLGMKPEVFAEKAYDAILQRKNNVYIGGIKEQAAMLLKRLMPSVFDWFIKDQKVV